MRGIHFPLKKKKTKRKKEKRKASLVREEDEHGGWKGGEEERWGKRERLGMDSPGCIATAGFTESQG